jgi:nicotinate-nucleotide pyrophosphorylase (carboxylating)
LARPSVKVPGNALNGPRLDRLVRAALAEDIGGGDVTSRSLIPPALRARGTIVAKESAVVAGLPVVVAVFGALSRQVRVRRLVPEGSRVPERTKVALLTGPARALLAGERVALNFLARLSGIATLTRAFASAARPYGVRILDTRKTTPLLRELEKYAVRAGGGTNHRMGLFDAVLIKDNHVAAVGGLGRAVAQARKRAGRQPIEVEAQSPDQVREAVAARPDIIMLDNLDPADLKRAIRLIRHRKGIRIELSGGVNLDSVVRLARLRPDYISVGALTHSAPAVDFSLEITGI